MNEIQEKLIGFAEEKYRAFSAGLIPNIDKETVLGVRLPILRKIAKDIGHDNDFLSRLPHRFLEENHLHSLIICDIKDFEKCIAEVERFLQFVDNWAVCDSMRPKCFGKNKDLLLPYIYKWIRSDHTYTVRFGILMLMTHFLGKNFDTVYATKVSQIESGEYYVNMMIAWYFATALATNHSDIIVFFEQKRLSVWVHNKAIQKAVESYRITDTQKQYLKTLKLKKT